MLLLAEALGGSNDPRVLLRLGAMEGQSIAAGDYWRLFTAMFLHAGWLHLGLNCFALFVFGQQLEQLFGRWRFTAIYLLAGLGGSVASYALNLSLSDNAIGVGASGAVFGALGALTAFFGVHRERLGDMGRRTLSGLLILAGVNIAFGLAVPDVDNFAHIGGFLSGCALGVAFAPIYAPVFDPFGMPAAMRDVNSILKRWWAIPVAALVLVIGVAWGNRSAGDSPLTHVRLAEDHRQRQDYAAALDELDKAIELDPFYRPSYIARAEIMRELGNVDMAIEDVGKAIRLSESPSERNEALRLFMELSGER